MALSAYLQPANAGKQIWQLLKENITSGDHGWNFVGICQALVSQWFVELNFANGRPPEELGRYLLQADLGEYGYNSIFKAQGDNLTLKTQSGSALDRQTDLTHAIPVDANSLGIVVLARLRGVDEMAADSKSIETQIVANRHDPPIAFSLQLSIHGPHYWLVRLYEKEWGHAIGIHCNGILLYVFDPNAGVYIIDPSVDENVNGFFNDIWASYGATSGRLDPIARCS